MEDLPRFSYRSARNIHSQAGSTLIFAVAVALPRSVARPETLRGVTAGIVVIEG